MLFFWALMIIICFVWVKVRKYESFKRLRDMNSNAD